MPDENADEFRAVIRNVLEKWSCMDATRFRPQHARAHSGANRWLLSKSARS